VVRSCDPIECARHLAAHRSQIQVVHAPATPLAVSAHSEYARRYLLPTVGPTTYLLGRMLAELAATADETNRPVSVPLAQLAEALGITASTSPNAALARSLGRLVRFGLAHIDLARSDALHVPTEWPMLDQGQHRRLPGWLRVLHAHDLFGELGLTNTRPDTGLPAATAAGGQ
jgi:hypothetical protein